MSDEKYDLWHDETIVEARDSAAALERDSKRAKKFDEDGELIQDHESDSER